MKLMSKHSSLINESAAQHSVQWTWLRLRLPTCLSGKHSLKTLVCGLHRQATNASPLGAYMPKYFHELTDDEFDALKENGVRWCDLPALHPQPVWCEYPDALAGEMGCWSLVYRRGVNQEFCKTCELYNAAHLTPFAPDAAMPPVSEVPWRKTPRR